MKTKNSHKLLFLFVYIICMESCLNENKPDSKAENNQWNVEKERKHLKNRQDSSTWDIEMFTIDLTMKDVENRPVKMGVFPVPKYALLGKDTFKGLGVSGNFRNFGKEGHHLIYNSFFVLRNKLIEENIPEDKPDEVFFTIVVLSDAKIDTIDYNHTQNLISSRNNPDYIGEGSIKTNESQVDYLAFLTAERHQYAIVNMRLFKLKYGRIVLIAPQKDGSFRSMQLDSEEVLSSGDVEKYIDRMLQKNSVLNFFNAQGNI